MVVLGIVLIALAVLFGLGVSVSSTASTTLEVFGVDFGVAVPTVFFLGAVAGAALMVGLWLTKKGLGRGYRRHKEMRELRAQATTSDTTDTTATGDTTGSSATGDAAPAAGGTATSDTVGGEITESDAGADVPAGTSTAAEAPSDERLAVERELAPDPHDTKQPR